MMNPNARLLCVVLHDVAPPTWDRCRQLIARLGEIADFRLTLLAVPQFHGSPRDAAFEAWLQARAARGDEIVLHGYTHRDDRTPNGLVDRIRRRIYTRGEGEFCDLDVDEATRRLDAGMAWLHELGLRPQGFVAPAWLLGADAWTALCRQRFDYTCTVRRILKLPRNARPEQATAMAHATGIVCQAQVYSTSTAWRRACSVLWNQALAWLQRRQRVVRLELHPNDELGVVAASWHRLARRQAATRRIVTLREIADTIAG